MDLNARDFRVEKYIQPPLFIPQNIPALKVLGLFREFCIPKAFVFFEIGGFLGVVSFYEALEVVASSIPADLADK